jgi:dynein heavy chain
MGAPLGKTEDNGTFVAVSLGQGQEPVAEKALEVGASVGGWVLLQNIELVASWLPKLEKKLEALVEGAHPEFRVFLSALPQKVVPVAVLQSSIKLTNEPPSGLKANMLRAYGSFGESVWESTSKPSELKSMIFALCFFHSVVCERRKFGPIGWNRGYPFNPGDLSVCITVAQNYLEASPKVPWDDLRYIFGEIMYGGHITDAKDRRLCASFLQTYVREELLDNLEFFPKFPVPPPSCSHKQYCEYIEERLAVETPAAYGLHPNSEIGFMTRQAEALFASVAELQPRAAGGGGGMSLQERVKRLLDDIVEKLPDLFPMGELEERSNEDRSPYVGVFLQECERMNGLLFEMKRSLGELDMGLRGDLSITESMEALMNALYDDKVPATWANRAYPSLRALAPWLFNMLERQKQLEAWTADLATPKVTWLSGLFNPQAFLTAVMQVTARKNEWPLDKLVTVVEVSKKAESEVEAARDGAYTNGLFMEGARWDAAAGVIDDAIMKQLYPQMPLILIKAATAGKDEARDIYACPVYMTQDRGPTFVFTAGLKSKAPPIKWVLAGVALLMDCS